MNKKINVLLFFTVLFGFPLLTLLLPKVDYSEDEKRKLAQFPVFSWESYLAGHWTNKIDKYFDDHFPFRRALISWTPLFHAAKGFESKNEERVVVFKRKGKSPKEQAKAEIRDTLTFLDEFEENFSGAMVIIDGCVYPMGAGSPKMGKAFASITDCP